MDYKTTFKRQFLSDLLAVLSNDKQLKQARAAYTQNEQDQRRYHCHNGFGMTNWDKEMAINFSAAVFEALARASTLFLNNPDLAKHLQAVYEEIKEHVVPALTDGVNALNPIPDVKTTIRQELKRLEAQSSFVDNPFVFYGGIALAATVATAAVLTLGPSNGPK